MCLQHVQYPVGQKMDFNKAIEACEAINATLFEPRSDVDFENIEHLLANYAGSDTSFWIGIVLR